MNVAEMMMDDETDNMEVVPQRNVITVTTTDHTVPLSVGTRAAEIAFNELKDKIPDLGLPLYLVKSSDGTEKLVDKTPQLVAELLPIVFANGHTSNPWIEGRLVNIGVNDAGRVAIAFNKWLIDEGFIERRSVEEWTMIDGHPAKVKRWLLTEHAQNIRREFTEGVKFAPLETPASDKGIKKRVKGRSKMSNFTADALRKQDRTALKYHPLAKGIFAYYKGKARTDESAHAAEAQIRELEALEEDYNTRRLKAFYLTHSCDYRFRMYARGGYVSTQGSKAQKIGITFNEGREANMDEIYVYLARNGGYKGNWKSAREIGKEEAANPTSIATKAILTDPERAIVRVDGCANGIQWMSALLNNAKGMELTNLTGRGPQDLYTVLAEHLGFEGRIVDSRIEHDDGSFEHVIKWRSARDQAKMFIMPYGYGASQKKLAMALGLKPKEIAKLIDKANKILPIGQFLAHIRSGLESMNEVDVENLSLEELQRLSDGIAIREALDSPQGENRPEEGLPESFEWELPDGARVIHEAKSYTEVKGIDGNFSMKIYDSEAIDYGAMTRALAPNLIHSIDAYHARLIMNKADFPVVAIHDSFGCHSSNVMALRQIIQETFQQILEEDVLNSILKQLGLPTVGRPAEPATITNPYMFM